MVVNAKREPPKVICYIALALFIIIAPVYVLLFSIYVAFSGVRQAFPPESPRLRYEETPSGNGVAPMPLHVFQPPNGYAEWRHSHL